MRSPDESATHGTALLRAPSALTLSLAEHAPTDGWLLPKSARSRKGIVNTRLGHAVEVLPVRTGIKPALCRDCGMCIEVCPFDAAKRGQEPLDGSPTATRIDAALCRGCNLCSAVCPTQAARSTTLSPEWWGRRLEDATQLAAGRTPPATPYVVLACQRRAGALEGALDQRGLHLELIRFRCVGQVEAGMLLEFLSHGVERILVAGCSTDRCRFDKGALRALLETERAISSLRMLGRDPAVISHDWSSARAYDPLGPAVDQFVQRKEVGDA